MPQSVHPAASWQKIQEYLQPHHQTTQQLHSSDSSIHHPDSIVWIRWSGTHEDSKCILEVVLIQPTWLQSESLLWIFLRTTVDISIQFCCYQTQLFFSWSDNISICDRGDRNRYFKPNQDVFQLWTKWFLCLNLTRVWTRHYDKREIVNST